MLHCACAEGHESIVRLLLANKAHINATHVWCTTRKPDGLLEHQSILNAHWSIGNRLDLSTGCRMTKHR
jgi:ankyrin repeat protein